MSDNRPSRTTEIGHGTPERLELEERLRVIERHQIAIDRQLRQIHDVCPFRVSNASWPEFLAGQLAWSQEEAFQRLTEGG